MRRWLIRLAVASILLAALGALGVAALKGAPGRMLAMALIDGREFDGVGVVTLEGLEGDLTRAFRLERVTVHDAEGTLFVLDALEMRWRVGALLHGRVALDAVAARQVRINRLPEGGEAGGTDLPDILVSAGDIDALVIEGLPEQLSRLRVKGRVTLDAHAVDANLRIGNPAGDTAIVALSVAGDRVSLDASGAMNLDGQVFALEAALAGTKAAGNGAARISKGDAVLVETDLSWEREIGRLRAAITSAALDALELPTIAGGATVRLDVSAGLPDTAGRSEFTGRLEAGGPVLEAEGTLGPSGAVAGRARLTGWAADPVRLEALHANFNWMPDRPLRLDAHLRPGALSSEDAALAAWLAKLRAARARARLDVGGARLDALHLDTVYGEIVAEGQADADGAYHLRAKVARLEPAGLTDAVTSLTGAVLNVDGRLDGPARFTLTVDEIAVPGLAPCGAGVASLEARGALAGDTVELSHGSLRAGACAIEATGQAGTGGATFEGEVVSTEALETGPASLAAPVAARVEGSFAEGRLKLRSELRARGGRLGNQAGGPLRVRLQASSPLDALSGEAVAEIGEADGRLSLTVDAAMEGDTLRVETARFSGAGWRASGAGRIGADALQFRLDADGPQDQSLSLSAKGAVEALALAAEARRGGDTPVGARFDGRLGGGSDRLALDGRLDVDAAGFPLGGRLSGEASADGATARLVANAADWLSLEADAVLSPAGLSVDARLVGDGVDGEGTLTVDRGEEALRGEADLRLDLATLAVHVPAFIEDAGGLVTGRFTVSGPIDAPRANAEVRVSAAGLRVPSAGSGLQVADGVVAYASGAGWTVEADAQDLNRGRLTGSGTIAEDLSAGAVTFDYESLRLLDTREALVEISGRTELTAVAGVLTIGGETVIDRADLQPAGAQGPSFAEIEYSDPDAHAEVGAGRRDGPGLAVRLDHRIRGDRGIFVSGDRFESVWSGDVRLQGEIGAPSVYGEVILDDGEFRVLGRPLTLSEGRVIFDGDPMNARIAATAQRTLENITARVSVSGSIGAPRIDLSSRPDLPEDEVLARLAFGRGVGQLSPVEIAQLTALLTEAAGGDTYSPFSAIGAAVSLDRFALSTDSEGRSVLALGRRLGDNVMLEVEAGGAFTATEIEWSLRPNVSLLSRISGDADSLVALLWGVDFE